MESYELAEAAERAGVSPDELRELVELGILQPDAAGRFSEGDVRRVGVVQSTVAAGIPIDLLADTLRSGQFSLAFMDDPAYDRFTSLTSETFQELSARTGLPLHLLIAVREATGGVTPAPEDRVREGERPIVTLLEFQIAHGFRPITLERNLRVFGDSLRRIAETGGDTWRSEVLEPLFAAGKSGVELGAASSEVSEGMTELDEEALLAIYRAHQARVWTANIIGGAEASWPRPACTAVSSTHRRCASWISPATRASPRNVGTRRPPIWRPAWRGWSSEHRCAMAADRSSGLAME